MRNATHKQSLPVYIMYIAGLLLFTLNLLRVLNVTITHDEALTYQWYVTHSYADIISGSMITANNHFLNSILAKFFIELFSDNLFFLRLPNLLAYAAYLILSIAITRKLFSNAWWVLSCFLLLQLNPFMFEFFGLCRGYGLSIAFMIAAIYALLNFIQTRKIASVISVSVCMFLAVFSNLSMLNMLMTFQLILLLYWWQNRKMQGALKPLLISILLTLITLAAVYEPIRLLIEKAQLYYGGDKGFVNDTVQSLLHETFFLSAEGDGLLITSWLISSIVLLVGLMLTIKAVRSKQLSNTWFVLWLLLFVPALSTVTQNILLGNKYLIERTALFLYPLFTLFIVRACDTGAAASPGGRGW